MKNIENSSVEQEDVLTQIKSLGNIPEELNQALLRVANGLIQRADYPLEKVLELFAMMLQNPKKYAYSKNKVTNIAQRIHDLKTQGIDIQLSVVGESY